jgi:hypothetical protein
MQTADSCSHELLQEDEMKPETIKSPNGHLCQISDTAAHPFNLDNGNFKIAQMFNVLKIKCS